MNPKWLDIAQGEVGVKEVPGSAANPRIVAYDACTTLKATSDEVAWCSSFVNWCMAQAGIKGTGYANARSWLNWGVPLEKPIKGCVVVFRRGADPVQGHVSFYIETVGTAVRCLGGNQGDQVKISAYPLLSVLGYRWPNEVPLPDMPQVQI